MQLTMSMFAKKEHYFEARVKQLEAERDKLKAALREIHDEVTKRNPVLIAHEALKESA